MDGAVPPVSRAVLQMSIDLSKGCDGHVEIGRQVRTLILVKCACRAQFHGEHGARSAAGYETAQLIVWLSAGEHVGDRPTCAQAITAFDLCQRYISI